MREAVANAETIFVNAVMGYTSKGFHEGTAALDALIASNSRARKYFGGGDTIHEFKSLSPGLYMSALEDPRFYLFTGGGTVLKALELGGPEKLATVEALAMKPDEAAGAEAESERAQVHAARVVRLRTHRDHARVRRERPPPEVRDGTRARCHERETTQRRDRTGYYTPRGVSPHSSSRRRQKKDGFFTLRGGDRSPARPPPRR